MNYAKKPNYVLSRLPCGIEINRDWRLGQTMECCRTVCKEKDNGQIERCYKGNEEAQR